VTYEFRNDSVENHIVIVVLLREADKVLDSLGYVLRVELDVDVSLGCVDDASPRERTGGGCGRSSDRHLVASRLLVVDVTLAVLVPEGLAASAIVPKIACCTARESNSLGFLAREQVESRPFPSRAEESRLLLFLLLQERVLRRDHRLCNRDKLISCGDLQVCEEDVSRSHSRSW
jgi:hypothetical protein